MKEKVIAIVPAAGIGRRFGEGTNKPFEMLGNKPLLMWALETLDAIQEIKEIIPVIKEEDMEQVVELFEQYRVPKVKRIAPGGKERQDSVFHGLNLIDDKKSIVLIHDGVRPLAGADMIRNAIKELKDCSGVVAGVPVKDTIKEVEDGEVRQTLKRGALWAIQTPQIFPYAVIHQAYEKASREQYYSTDDSALVERYGGKVKVVAGSYSNIKITTPEDLRIAETLLNMMEGRI